MASLIIPGVQLMDPTGAPVSIGGDPTVTPAVTTMSNKLPPSLGAQTLANSLSVTPVTPDTLAVLGLQQSLTVDATSRALPAPTTGGTAKYAFVQTFQPIWYRVDGQAATTAAPSLYLGGAVGAPGQAELFSPADVANFRYVSAGAGSGASLLLRG